MRTLKSSENECLVRTNLKVNSCYFFSKFFSVLSFFFFFFFSVGTSEVLEFRLTLVKDIGGDTEIQVFSFPMNRFTVWQSSQEKENHHLASLSPPRQSRSWERVKCYPVNRTSVHQLLSQLLKHLARLCKGYTSFNFEPIFVLQNCSSFHLM